MDQSPITGESLPVEKAEGDPVYAATVNASGSNTASPPPPATPRLPASSMPWSRPRARARRRSASSTASRIYTPVVVGVAVLVAVVPPLLWSQPWFDAIYRALALLIIASPLRAGDLHAGKHRQRPDRRCGAASGGQGGVYLEEGRNLQWLALDKTGT